MFQKSDWDSLSLGECGFEDHVDLDSLFVSHAGEIEKEFIGHPVIDEAEFDAGKGISEISGPQQAYGYSFSDETDSEELSCAAESKEKWSTEEAKKESTLKSSKSARSSSALHLSGATHGVKKNHKEKACMKPSSFCHICQRKANTAPVLTCFNLRSGNCRKVICKMCFAENKWDFNAAARNPEWTCVHCKDLCPSRAQCNTYKKTNDRRRAGGKVPPKMTSRASSCMSLTSITDGTMNCGRVSIARSSSQLFPAQQPHVIPYLAPYPPVAQSASMPWIPGSTPPLMSSFVPIPMASHHQQYPATVGGPISGMIELGDNELAGLPF
uniref:Zinc-finger domain-containing protein n=1 Tax=Timspurckia oligopyrenoides TaxID=708627 RepID=A0A7S0ZFG1_9RHOD|mmetsp:Transcript_3130/g.5504  ORF Transcript_3130/g.5504 Transcript_3130/m.5504 type:complete len:326 (+) Transcript_3130:138-1115(+)|eukprot:CAMPEP_0182444858 /NCGR_PEP_ID=MMETSP1172-20130603/3171_1 /TAXON_ID=708627 /ORGANISM="Timspurckia oligopyrenoides, Strain CCMP3278" /LENGTH=325 /DNA_ID=CAMNT_0024640505 /DNA_START=87 /DNA_END=1064 /DNA_ORIENTATION=+